MAKREVVAGILGLVLWFNPAWAEPDDRQAVALTPSEKAYVMGQMRLFVGGIQGIVAALPEGKWDEAAELAAQRGFKRAANDPAFPIALALKLPSQWRTFGGTMRRGFDSLSNTLRETKDTGQSLKVLGELMQNCVACHATYRIVEEQ